MDHDPGVRIGLIQQHSTIDIAENVRRGLDAAMRAADQGAELVVFAELAFTPFYPQSPPTGDVRQLAEPVPGPTTEVFQRFARDRGVVVVLNLFERHEGRTYDCSPVIDADGSLLGRTRMIHAPSNASVTFVANQESIIAGGTPTCSWASAWAGKAPAIRAHHQR